MLRDGSVRSPRRIPGDRGCQDAETHAGLLFRHTELGLPSIRKIVSARCRMRSRKRSSYVGAGEWQSGHAICHQNLNFPI